MKKIITILSILLLPVFAYGASWVSASNQIGTNPVNGSILQTNGLFSSWVTPASLNIGFSTTSTDYWKTQNNFFSTTSTDYWLTQQSLGNQTPWTSDLDGGAYSLLNVGKIGIGTTTPPSPLTITSPGSGSGLGDGITFDNGDTLSHLFYSSSGELGVKFETNDGSQSFHFYNSDDNSISKFESDGNITFQYAITSATSTFNGGVKLNNSDTGLEFYDGTIQYTAATSPDLSPYQLISSAWATTSTNYWATTYAGAFTASGITTNGTASSTSLVVSDTSLKVGKGRLYDIIALDRASIADATTTDATAYPFGSNLRQGGPSFTITQVDAVIASTTFTGAQNTQGMSWNIHIANVPASSSPMHLFTSDVNTNSTSTIQSYTPTGTATIPAGYGWAFVPSSASSSQIGMFQYVIWGYYN